MGNEWHGDLADLLARQRRPLHGGHHGIVNRRVLKAIESQAVARPELASIFSGSDRDGPALGRLHHEAIGE